MLIIILQNYNIHLYTKLMFQPRLQQQEDNADEAQSIKVTHSMTLSLTESTFYSSQVLYNSLM